MGTLIATMLIVNANEHWYISLNLTGTKTTQKSAGWCFSGCILSQRCLLLPKSFSENYFSERKREKSKEILWQERFESLFRHLLDFISKTLRMNVKSELSINPRVAVQMAILRVSCCISVDCSKWSLWTESGHLSCENRGWKTSDHAVKQGSADQI